VSFHLAVLPFEAALIATLLFPPTRRVRMLFLLAFGALLFSLIAQSEPRHVGDTGQYVVMAENLGHFESPSASPADLARTRQHFPGNEGAVPEMPRYRGPDGRQDFPRFWFYSLIAAPFVRIAEAMGASPVRGFTALNVILLMLTAALLVSRISLAATVLVVAGPILWWVDKAHAEPLIMTLIAAALVLLRSSPWWSIVALGAASTQEPVIAGAMVLLAALSLYRSGWQDRRLWMATAVGVLLALLHPFYYQIRLGVWTGLFLSIDYHWPAIREIFTVPFDPNLGVFVLDPLLGLALAVACIEAATRPKRMPLDLTDLAIGLIVLAFLLNFSQVANVNSGGTPGLSRYGLWLVPFAIPVLSNVPASTRWSKALAALAVVWCATAFAPDRADQYLRPTEFAAELWTRWPSVDNPVAEIFAERVSGLESASPPLATAGCEKILLMGDGKDAPWPVRCGTYQIAGFCGESDSVCYANRNGNDYRFVRAPSSPTWRETAKRNKPPDVRGGGMLTITQTVEPRLPMALYHDEGWSYTERATEPTDNPAAREWRWIGESARLGVMSSTPVKGRLKFVAHAFAKPRRLRISLESKEVMTLLIAEGLSEYQTPAFDIPAGSHLIELESLDGAETPGGGDSRRLSVAIYRVELIVERE